MHNIHEYAQGLVELFYPFVEITIFDLQGSVEKLINPLSPLKEDQKFPHKIDLSVIHETLRNGKMVKSRMQPFRNGKKIGAYLRIRYELTFFKNLQDQLNIIIKEDDSSKQPASRWTETIDQSIESYMEENKITVKSMSGKQTRELICLLDQKGLFDFKESSAYIAQKLCVSRATVYNHLKTADNFKRVEIHQVDAFTDKKFGGNPAGVVLEAEHLDEPTMRKIARELNLSETAFVFNSKKADFHLRYFTPTGHEIGFCGHSTVGSLFTIAKQQRFGVEGPGKYPFKVETLCGILKMEVIIDPEGDIQVTYETPTVRLRSSAIIHTQVAKAAGCDLTLIDTNFPVMYEETNKDLFLMVHSLADLKNFQCDPKSFAQFSKQHDIVALCAFTQEAFEKESHYHMRCFAPLVGIPEDPFTGSVLGGLTAYLDKAHLRKKGIKEFRVEQGHFIDRPGVVTVQYNQVKGVYKVKVIARAVHCFSTEINL